jgi:hypothetical protein
MNVNLPQWAFPHDLALVVEFSRMTQAALEAASSSRRCPASTDVIEFISVLAVEFEARHFDTQWGEDADFLEATESFFDAAEKPSWYPTDEERAARADLDCLVALARRVGNAQVLDDEAAIAQAERDDEVCDAAGKRIVVALSAAGFRVSDYGDGIVEVHGWRPEWELRCCVGVEHDENDAPASPLLVDIIGVHADAYGDEPVETWFANNLPVEDLDLVVEQVRELFRQRDGGAA